MFHFKIIEIAFPAFPNSAQRIVFLYTSDYLMTTFQICWTKPPSRANLLFGYVPKLIAVPKRCLRNHVCTSFANQKTRNPYLEQVPRDLFGCPKLCYDAWICYVRRAKRAETVVILRLTSTTVLTNYFKLQISRIFIDLLIYLLMYLSRILIIYWYVYWYSDVRGPKILKIVNI